jgi:Glyoxalase-like domain
VRQKNPGSPVSACRVASNLPVQLHHIVIDAHDLPTLARFWTEALGWKVLSEREIIIGTDDNAPVGICFMPVTDPKTVKNRVHVDLTSSAGDRYQEIDRLLGLGARRVDIGQKRNESWTELADPEETSSAWCARRKHSPVKRTSAGTGELRLRRESVFASHVAWPFTRSGHQAQGSTGSG